MVDQRIEKLAELLVHYSLDVQPKNKVFIWSGMAAEPLIAAGLPQGHRCRSIPLHHFRLPGRG